MWTRIAAVGTVLAAFLLGAAYAQDTGNAERPGNTTSGGASTARDDNSGFDFGWLGLVGLAGLAGLMPRENRERHAVGSPAR